jgi:hypothetical protein
VGAASARVDVAEAALGKEYLEEVKCKDEDDEAIQRQNTWETLWCSLAAEIPIDSTGADQAADRATAAVPLNASEETETEQCHWIVSEAIMACLNPSVTCLALPEDIHIGEAVDSPDAANAVHHETYVNGVAVGNWITVIKVAPQHMAGNVAAGVGAHNFGNGLGFLLRGLRIVGRHSVAQRARVLVECIRNIRNATCFSAEEQRNAASNMIAHSQLMYYSEPLLFALGFHRRTPLSSDLTPQHGLDNTAYTCGFSPFVETHQVMIMRKFIYQL